MRRPASPHRPVFASFAAACAAAAWWGCGSTPVSQTTSTTSTGGTGGGGSSGATTGEGGAGGVDFDGGGVLDDAGACTSTSVAAEHIQLDMIFVIDRSSSMSGPKWGGTTSALSAFFNDPASAKIGAGMVYFPNDEVSTCVPADYQVLDVPINTLPANAFALTNSMPADATGLDTPTWGALKGALMAATAYQDTYPTHKVVVVLATDGEPNACGMTTIEHIADLAKGARNYNGVLTFVIGVAGSILANLHKIAIGGGTTAAYDITTDISQLAAKMEQIRSSALGCEFVIPPPPGGEALDASKVNFSYTPEGMGVSKTLLRADDLADCNNAPGWYYDSNLAPTKIILCPAACATVQADSKAKVDVLFGCKSQVN